MQHSDIMDFNFVPYILCFFTSSAIAFIDILDDYSIFKIKVGFKYKLLFAVFNGLIGVFLFYMFQNEVFPGFNPNIKGIGVGIFYPTLMK